MEAGILRWLGYTIKKILNLDRKNEMSLIAGQQEVDEEYGDIGKDADVFEEEKRIVDLVAQNMWNEIFVVDRLKKFYNNFMAVKGISLAVGQAECFGLLGVNGAGKTSTFKMITGDEVKFLFFKLYNYDGKRKENRNFGQHNITSSYLNFSN
jgi:ABC-type glutathione transport system ATPase component